MADDVTSEVVLDDHSSASVSEVSSKVVSQKEEEINNSSETKPSDKQTAEGCLTDQPSSVISSIDHSTPVEVVIDKPACVAGNIDQPSCEATAEVGPIDQQTSGSASKDPVSSVPYVKALTSSGVTSYNIWEDEDGRDCGFCGTSFPSTNELIIHLLAHVDVTCKEHLPLHKTKLCFYSNRYQCHNCKLKTRHRLMFQEHVRHHVLRFPYSCGVCSAELATLLDCRSHVTGDVCKANAADVIMKPTEIVRQVMKMLGPNAPATEHLYSVKLPKQAAPKGKSMAPSRDNVDSHPATTVTGVICPTESTSSLSAKEMNELGAGRTGVTRGEHISSQHSSEMSPSPAKMPLAQTSNQSVVGTTDIVVSEEESATKLMMVADRNILLKNTPNNDDIVDCSKDNNPAVEEQATEDVAWKPLILEVTSGEHIAKMANISTVSHTEEDHETSVASNTVNSSVNADLTDTMQTSDTVTSGASHRSDKSKMVDTVSPSIRGSTSNALTTEMATSRSTSSDKASTSSEVVHSGSYQFGGEVAVNQSAKFISQTTPAQADHPSNVTSIDSVNCPKLMGPYFSGKMVTDIQNTISTDVPPILIGDDDIQVVQVSHPQSAPREDSQSAETRGSSEGRSAEDPIVINDDDLHQASTNNAQNKIKIERRPNGIVLRLFRDNNGDMEDLSQLGLEVRKDMWYCCRCECSFANWQDFLPHVSDELHTIFNFHAGLCPVCKHSPRKNIKEAVPCKLARILLRVLSVVYRSIEKSKAATHGQGVSSESLTGPDLSEVSYSCPLINIAPQASFQTKPTTITMPQMSASFSVVGNHATSTPALPPSNQNSNVTISTIPSASPIVIMPQDPVGLPANQGSGQSPVFIIPVQQAGIVQAKSSGQIITPIVIAPTPVVSVSTTQRTPPVITVSGEAAKSNTTALPQSNFYQHQMAAQSLGTVPLSHGFPTSAAESYHETSLHDNKSKTQHTEGQAMEVENQQNTTSPSTPMHSATELMQTPVQPTQNTTQSSLPPVQMMPTSEQNTAVPVKSILISQQTTHSALQANITETVQKDAGVQFESGNLSKATTIVNTSVSSVVTDSSPATQRDCKAVVGHHLDIDVYAAGEEALNDSSDSAGDLGTRLVIDEQPLTPNEDTVEESDNGERAPSENGMNQQKDGMVSKVDVEHMSVLAGSKRKSDYSSSKLSQEPESYHSNTELDMGFAKKHKLNTEESSVSQVVDKTALVISQLPKIAPKPATGHHKGDVKRRAVAVGMKKLRQKRKTSFNKRRFVGEFMYSNKKFICVSCRYQHRSESIFRKHLSKHVHGKLNSRFCNHCPPDVIYNRLGQCPLLKQMITFMKLAAKMKAMRKQREYAKNETHTVGGSSSDRDESAMKPADDDDDDDDGLSLALDDNIADNDDNLAAAKCTMMVSEVSHSEKCRRYGDINTNAKGKDGDTSTTESNEEVPCSRLRPYQKRDPWPKRNDLQQQLLKSPSTDVALSDGPKLSIKCAVDDCDFRAVVEDEFRLHNYIKHANVTVYPCSYCSKKFPDMDELLRHLDSHRDWVYKCTFCGCNFGARKLPEYENHLLERHSDLTDYKCCFCPVQASSISGVIRHIELHVRIQIKCPYCEKTSSEKKQIQTHIASVHRDQPKKVVVSTQIIPNLDEQVLHASGVEQTQKSKSLASVSAPAEYVPHPKTSCEKCNYVSLSREQAKIHSRLHESEQDKEKDFICRQCPFSCDLLDEYRLHVQQHTGITTMRIYMCAHCKFSTMHMMRIEDHLADEHMDKPFKFEVLQEKVNHMQTMEACSICGELVLNTSDRHMKEHHAKCHNTVTTVSQASDSSNVMVEWYHCDMCQYSAHDEAGLVDHLSRIHNVQPSAQTEPQEDQSKVVEISSPAKIIEQVQASKNSMALYECDLCSYKTANKKMFIDHHRQHAEGVGLTSYKCEFCPYESTKYKNLVSHQKVHTRSVDEGYKCAYCFYMNTIKSRVSWHISAYHPGKEKKIVEINNGAATTAVASLKKSRQQGKGHQTPVHQPCKEKTAVVSVDDQATELASGAVPQQTPDSPVAQILDDEDLKDFERNLPADAIFKHPVYCPFCPFSNQVRQNMLHHLKSHVKSKSAQSQAVVPSTSTHPVEQPAVSKALLTFFKRSTEISVFQCCLCEYVHVNGSDMVRHFLCEHVTMGCAICEHRTSTTGRMKEHFITEHGGRSLNIYLKKSGKHYRLSEKDFKKIELMEKETLLQEQDSDHSQESDLVDDSHDFDEESAEVLKHCKMLKLNNRIRYKCVYCGYTNGLPLIRRHVLSVHMKFLAFSCKYCKTKCREKYHLQQHIHNVHPGSPVVVHRRKFDPQRHGKIVKKTVDNMYRRKRKHSDSDDGKATGGSESEQNQSFEVGSLGCFTPSRESVSSLESTPCSSSTPIPCSSIKQEDVDRHSTPKSSRIMELQQTGQQTVTNDSSDETTGTPKGKKILYCAYCDYASHHVKQDIQRHILLKHLQIHVFVCKKCKFSTNNRRSIELHRKLNKGHSYRDFTNIKDKIVEIHQDGNGIMYGFPEGQLTKIQQDLENIPGLFLHMRTVAEMHRSGDISPARNVSGNSLDIADATDCSDPAVSGLGHCTSASFEQDSSFQDDVLSPDASGSKNVEDVASIKLPKTSVYSCAYCEYTSKYNRGDVRKHILFKHFLNKKYTCAYCNYGAWDEQAMKMHFQSAHPSQPENMVDNSFENQCIVPVMKTQRCLTLGVRTPANSPVQLQKNILHQCKLCSFEVPNMIKLKLHIIVKHWNLKPYQCPVCKDLRWKRHAVREHLKKVHPEVNEVPVVTYIKKSAELMNLATKKVIFTPVLKSSKGTDATKTFVCMLCSQTALSQSDLEEHMKTHRVYSCIYCPFEAESKSIVQNHIEAKHSEYPVRIKTLQPLLSPSKPTTPFTASNDGSSKNRPTIKHESKPLKKTFTRNIGSMVQGLSRHGLKLSITKSYKCNLCSHQVQKLRDILEHLCKHYNYYRFVCTYCNVRTIREYLMKKHLEKKHPEVEPLYKVDSNEQLETEVRRGYTLVKRAPKRNKECVMFCPLCAKRCGRQSSLREHIMRDLNYRPYVCPFCDYCECTGGKVNFHMHQTHKDGSGRYEFKPNVDLATRVDKLVDEAKNNAEKKIFPKITLKPKYLPAASESQTKPRTLVVKFPKMQIKDQWKPKLKIKVKTETEENRTRESSVASSSSVSSEQVQQFRFMCHMCEYGTNKEKLLKCHLMRRHGTKRWKCFYCDCKAVYRSTIIKHVRDSHKYKTMKVVQILPTSKESYKDEPDVEVVLAPTAYGKAEPQLLSLLKNRPGGGADLPTVKHPGRVVRHSSESGDDIMVDKQGVYHCTSCSYNTSKRRLLRMHLLCHKKADLKCFYCHRIYRVMFRFRRHCLMRHKDKPVKWYSLATGELREESVKSEGLTSDPATQITDVTKSPQTLYCCHMCNACLNTAEELFQHVRDEHSGMDSASLSSQQSSNHSDANSVSQRETDDRLHQCIFCSFSTYDSSELDKHTKGHDIHKPFHCFYCDYSCLYRSEAKRHCQRKHPGRRIAFTKHNEKPCVNTPKSCSTPGRPRVMLTNLLSLDDDKLRGLLESNKIKTLHTFDASAVEESDESSSFSMNEGQMKWDRQQASGPSRRPRKLQCILDGCGRTFSYSFDVYRHQRTHHNVSSDMYQKGVGATFKAFRVLEDDGDCNN